jgi:hypothetical protein
MRNKVWKTAVKLDDGRCYTGVFQCMTPTEAVLKLLKRDRVNSDAVKSIQATLPEWKSLQHGQ